MKRAVVVGSGAAGGTVARLLAMSGRYHVVILEKGSSYYTGLGGPAAHVRSMWSNDELAYNVRPGPFDQDPVTEPRTFRPSPSHGARTHVGDVDDLPTTAGGGTTHWDAKARRLREVDFVANTLFGGSVDTPGIPGTSYADWPMTYRHLEPFYAVMEEVAGIQGPAFRDAQGRVVNPNPYESWRSTPFPMPPGVAMFSNLLQAEAAARLGYHPAPVPTAINSRPYRGRPACVDCGFCLNFGCTINAKGCGIWQVNDALVTGRAELRTNAHVIAVEVVDRPGTNGRHRAGGVTYLDGSGVRHTIGADLVVLANSPIEATRLSLASGIGTARPDESRLSSPQPGPYEPSGLLGRNIMFHYATTIGTVLDRDVHAWRGRTSTHTLDAFAGAGPSPAQFDASVPRAGICELGGNLLPIQWSEYLPSTTWGQAAKDAIVGGIGWQRAIGFTLQGEDMPQASNYVDLDPEVVDVWGQSVPRITYANHNYEIDAANHYTPIIEGIGDAIGGPGSAYPDVKAVGSTVVQGGGGVPSDEHIMGTHRMAFDPGHGPCTPFGRYWAFDNLFHTGGGLFVTAPGFNPTLTIWALSYWVAAAILAGVAGTDVTDVAGLDAAWPQLLGAIGKLDADTMIAKALANGTWKAAAGG